MYILLSTVYDPIRDTEIILNYPDNYDNYWWLFSDLNGVLYDNYDNYDHQKSSKNN